MIAALYVETNGTYYGLPNVDPWDRERDARRYDGPYPVVAHPPCSSWCQLAHINQKRWGRKVGDDGGCFEAALSAVRRWGGVLEHPAFSYAWQAFGMPRPPWGCWQRSIDGAWVTTVCQGAYGCPAIKRTWLYYVGEATPPALNWSEPEPSAQVSNCANHGNSPLPRITKKKASSTPIPFRDLLIGMAKTAQKEAS